MKRLLPSLTLCLCALAAAAQTPSQYVLFTANNITDLAGNKLASGTFTATPVLTPESTVPAAPQLVGGGRGIAAPIVFNVTGGVLSAAYGTAQLVDVTQANPANFCYSTQIHDNNTGNTWNQDACLQPAYNATGCTVTSGQTTCDYDNMVPTGVPGALQVAGPRGLTWQGTWSSLATYQIGDAVSYNGASYVSIVAGNTATPPGTGWSLLAAEGASAITGLSGDGAGDATLTGKFTAGSVAANKAVSQGTSSTPSYPYTAANQDVGYQFAASRYGRVSMADLPNLQAAMANYNFTTQPPIIIAALGSSIGVGANLTNPATDAACSQFVSDLTAAFPGKGGLGYNFQCANLSVNGSVATQYTAAWQGLTQYALSGVAINAAGTGYAVGDWETVNTGPNGQCGAVVVTSVGAGGSVTGIKISNYPGTLTDADSNTDTTCVNVPGTGFATINGPPANAAISEQTGTGSGLTVNVTALGYKPTVVLMQYQMNDAGPLEYNSGQTVGGYTTAMSNLLSLVQNYPADAVVFTSHHSSVVLSGSSQWAWNTSIPCDLSDFMTTCDPSSSGNTSVVNQTTSVSTLDPVGLGTSITLASRMQVLNDRARALAQHFGASVIDIEKYWEEAMECGSATTNLCQGTNPNGVAWTSYGSQSEAETAYFTVAGPHINTLGASLSYWPAIRDFVTDLKLQTAQEQKRPAYPFTTSSGITLGAAAQYLGPTTSSVAVVLPANTSGVLTVWAANSLFGPSQGQYGFTTCSTFGFLGPETGTNVSSGTISTAEIPRLFTASLSGLTVSLTTTSAVSTYFDYRIDSQSQTIGCPATGTSAASGKLLTYPFTPQGWIYNVGAATNVTVTLPDNSSGTVTLSAFNGGVAQSQIYSNTFTTHSGVAYLAATPSQIGPGTEFALPTVSGLTLTFLSTYASTNYQWVISLSGGGGSNALPLSGTTGSIGGSALTAGQYLSGTANISNATTGMTCDAQPSDGTNMWQSGFVVGCTVTATNTATVTVEAVVAGTPAAKTYNVRVIQ